MEILKLAYRMIFLVAGVLFIMLLSIASFAVVS